MKTHSQACDYLEAWAVTTLTHYNYRELNLISINSFKAECNVDITKNEKMYCIYVIFHSSALINAQFQ